MSELSKNLQSKIHIVARLNDKSVNETFEGTEFLVSIFTNEDGKKNSKGMMVMCDDSLISVIKVLSEELSLRAKNSPNFLIILMAEMARGTQNLQFMRHNISDNAN